MKDVQANQGKDARWKRWVYFVLSPSLKRIKVGVTRRPGIRIPELQVGSAEELLILGVFPAATDTERRLHKQLAPYRVRGEWFSDVPAIRTLINNMGKEFGIKMPFGALSMPNGHQLGRVPEDWLDKHAEILGPYRLFGTEQLARLWDVSRRTIRRWIGDGHLRAGSIGGGGRRYVTGDEVERFVKEELTGAQQD